jgi:hypothetical protein
MQLALDTSAPTPDPVTVLTEEEIYEVWLNCHQTMNRIHDRDEAEAVGNPEVRAREIPEYFSDRQRELAEYILIRESMRAVGRC